MAKVLKGLKVAVLAADGFEQLELTSPVKALCKHGAEVEILSLRRGKIMGVNGLLPGKRVKVDRTLHSSKAESYDAVVLPGGLMSPDALRQSEDALQFVRDADRKGLPIAVICHGPWLLASAGLVRGRRLTSWPGIQDDLKNAGAVWTDSPVVRNGNWVSSRSPLDLPVFNETMVSVFSESMPAERKSPRRWGRWLVGSGLALGLARYALAARSR